VPGSSAEPYASRIAALERQIASVGNKTLFSASIGSGGITIQDGGSIHLPAGGTITDGVGNIIFSADDTTGERLSTPFLSVPMVPLWDGGDFQTGVAAAFGEYSVKASQVTTETVLWRGSVPQMLHPGVRWRGAVGRMTGTTSTPTYRLYIAGELVGTWTAAGLAGLTTAQFDTTDFGFGDILLDVTVSIQATPSSADYLAFSTTNVIMCGQ
jgi:hypothetical protein